MSSVYLDPSTLVMPDPGGRADHLAVPGAGDALRNLRDVVDDVIVLAPDTWTDIVELPSGVRAATTLPEDLGPDAWFVTADPESPFGRPGGATTILVGPRRAPGQLPLPRYDIQARDLPAAVLEILARQAMG